MPDFQHMSDVTYQYTVRTRQVAEDASFRTALSNTLRHQRGWMVKQVSFIAGARSLNQLHLLENLLHIFKFRKQGSNLFDRNWRP